VPEDIEIFKAMEPVKRLQFAKKTHADAINLTSAALKSFNLTMSDQQIETEFQELFLHGTPLYFF
jgi:hypothetical protein